ncbi:MAG: hypothetical protein JHC81_02350 [Brevundimonas sp.]|uniref:hypothetical protein n=1 Tax=Brevundimonas sp. TaxID=1871086 RepID=UPI001A2D3139|nr:hypothetical protein [Brevundimonas sp.]MBJ7446350.1 hypothetical protein [Brevundimonas sp.]
MRLPALFAALALSAALPTVALAQTPGPAAAPAPAVGVTVADARTWLTGLGGSVGEPEAVTGAQILRVADEPLPWNLTFYACTTLCDDLQFSAVFTGPLTIEQANQWNLQSRYLKAAFSPAPATGGEPSIVLQYDVLLTQTGTAQLQEPTVIWLQQLRGFAQMLTGQPPAQ